VQVEKNKTLGDGEYHGHQRKYGHQSKEVWGQEGGQRRRERGIHEQSSK
jgi:hypothetical protein